MDLELLESLALSDDRTAAIAQLLPGSTEHDYYRVLQAQHAGRLDEAQRIMDGWYERHGSYVDSTLHQRQLLYKLAANPADAATDVRDLYGASFDHEAEIDAVDPSRPTRLAGFSAQAFLEHALHYDLHQVTDEALYELIGTSLDERQRRALLTRLGHTPLRVVPLVHADLVAGTTFGALGIHDQLTLAQLAELAELRPALRGDARWGRRVRAPSAPAGVGRPRARSDRARRVPRDGVGVRRDAAAVDELAEDPRRVAPPRHRAQARPRGPAGDAARVLVAAALGELRAERVAARHPQRARRPARHGLPGGHRAAADRRRRGAGPRPAVPAPRRGGAVRRVDRSQVARAGARHRAAARRQRRRREGDPDPRSVAARPRCAIAWS